jgi:DNA-binding CsgD family transcriptional regulator/PAS domain-containing protein
MTELEALSGLLNSMYDSALDGSGWPDFITDVGEAFGTHSCALQIRLNGEIVMLGTTENLTPALLQEYMNHYGETDIWARAIGARMFDTVHLGRDLATHEVVSRSEYYEFMNKADLFDFAGAVVTVGPGEVGIICVHRRRQAAEFEEWHRRKMHLLVPHLQRSLKMSSAFRKHAIQHGMMTAALDSLAIAVILADDSGRVLYANQTAVATLRKGDGLTEREGRLKADTADATQTLLHLVGAACRRDFLAARADTPDVLVLRRSASAFVSAMIVPLRAGVFSAARDEPMAMLLVRDGASSGASRPEILQALFGLTPAEAAIANELAQGCSLDEIAERKGASVHTVRAQLKSALRKTGAHRQAELVALVMKQTSDLAA